MPDPRYAIVPREPSGTMIAAAWDAGPLDGLTRNMTRDVIKAAIAAAPRFEADDALVERVARAIFGPVNEHWDRRWAALHETGVKYDARIDVYIDGKDSYRGKARAAIAAVVGE